jgi:lauroyl/myristoyl acyltransferase
VVFDESPLKDLYRRLVWGPYRRGLGRLPAGTELRLNRGLGGLVSLGARGKRERVRRNMARAFGEDPRLDAWVRQTFQTHFADQYVSWTFARIAGGEAGSYLDLQGRDELDRVLERGRGAVLMHPHMGPAQLPLCVLGAQGYAVNQVGGGGVAHDLSAQGRKAAELRARLEQDIPGRIWDGGGYIRPVLRALKDNEVVLSAVDGTGGGRELGRRFERRVLGQVMRVPVGAVFLAMKTGAALLPLHTFLGPRGYRSVIGPELKAPADLEEAADLVALQLDRWLRCHPGEWHFWDEFEPGRFLV